jgi:hypothetical protein
MADRVETRIGFFWVEDDVIRFASKPAQAQELADAVEAMRIFRDLAAGRRMPTVMEVSGVRSLTREARALYTTGPEAVETFAAVGLVVSGSSMARALVNFMMTVSRPDCPARMFESVADAVVWAKSVAGRA